MRLAVDVHNPAGEPAPLPGPDQQLPWRGNQTGVLLREHVGLVPQLGVPRG